MKVYTSLKKLVGPSPMFYAITKIRGGKNWSIETYPSVSDQDFESQIWDEVMGEGTKKPRLTARELQEKLAERQKILTSEQRLVQSVLEEAKKKTEIDPEKFVDLLDFNHKSQQYRWYLRFKRVIPLGIVGPFTNTELVKMAYASKLGLNSISPTLPGIIGFSLPSFFFFHMLSYYSPEPIKPICNFGKYALGGPFWVACAVVDQGLEKLETKIYGEPVPMDVPNTGGTIPPDIGKISDLEGLLKSYLLGKEPVDPAELTEAAQTAEKAVQSLGKTLQETQASFQ